MDPDNDAIDFTGDIGDDTLPESSSQGSMFILLIVVLVALFVIYRKLFGVNGSQSRRPTRDVTETAPPADHDAIRQKRLRRIAATELSAQATPPEIPVSSLDLRKSLPTISTQTEKPAEPKPQLPVASPMKPMSRLLAASDSSVPTLKPTTSEPVQVTPKPVDATPESILHNALLRIFAITVDKPSTGSNSMPAYLPNFTQELQSGQSASPRLLNGSDADAVLIERLPLLETPTKQMAYLIDVLTRLHKEQMSKRVTADQVSVVARSVASQAALLLLDADPKSNLLMPYLTATSTAGDSSAALADQAITMLLESMASQFDPELSSLLSPVITTLVDDVNAQSYDGAFLPPARALLKLLTIPSLIKFVDHPKWHPQRHQPEVGLMGNVTDPLTDSVLGCLFGLSGYAHVKWGLATFNFEERVSVQQIQDAIASTKHRSSLVRGLLVQLTTHMIKSPESRTALLDWIATNIVKSAFKSRTGLAASMDRGRSLKLHAVDGLFLNVSEVLVNLCMPFVDTIKNPSQLVEKLKLLDPEILATDSLGINLSGETMLSSREEGQSLISGASAENESRSKEFGFVTKLFFMTHIVVHSGLVTTIANFDLMQRHFMQIRQTVLRREAHPNPADPMEQQTTLMMKQQLKIFSSVHHAAQFVLDDPALIQPVLDLYTFTSHWIKSLMSNSGETAAFLSRVPEFIVEDIAKVLLYTVHAKIRLDHMKVQSMGFVVDPEVVTMLIVLMGERKVKNPHLRATISDVLLWLCRPDLASDGVVTSSGINMGWEDPLKRNPEALKKLIPALFQLYCDIERTGAPGEFYQKFNVRHQISLFLKHLRSLSEFQQSFKDAFRSELFTAFMNYILNDSIHLLDEVIAKLPKIREVELAMQDRATWMAQNPETRTEREQEHSQNEKIVSTYSRLGNESLLLLHYVTASDVATLLNLDMQARLAQLLNYYLVTLAGPKRSELAVKANDKLHFSPRTLLASLCEIYIQLERQCGEAFLDMLINDPRSFSIDIFKSCVKILTSKHILAEPTLSQFVTIVNKLEKKSKDQKVADDIAAEAPDEFLDPITATLMLDPVTLPSGIVMERSALERALLNKPVDPYTNKPLKIEEVVPDEPLKTKIHAWLREKREEKKQARQNTED